MRASKWLVLAAAGLALLGARRQEAAACSIGRVMRVRAPLFVLATARRDTVLTGSGAIEYTLPEDSPSVGRFHGQRFRLDRVGGDVPPELARARAAGVTDAILVPYGSECGVIRRWRATARWSAPGTTLMIDAALRPRADWVGGVPTFDVKPEHDAYPGAYTRYGDAPDAPVLTVEQAFALQQALPTWEAAERAPFAAYQPLSRWARANPELARRFPADVAISEAVEVVQPCTPAYTPHPTSGTYRLDVILEGTDTLRMFVRSDPRGLPGCAPARMRHDLTAVTPRMADTARLDLFGAMDAGTLPHTEEEARSARGGCAGGTVEVVNRPSAVGAGERSWDADFNYLALPDCFPGTPRVKALTELLLQAYLRHEPTDLIPGRFREDADGGGSFEQAWGVNGRTLLEVRGSRVGSETVAIQW